MQPEPTGLKNHNLLKPIVSTYYDIGELVHAEPIAKVTHNSNYKIETSFNGKKTFYLLRGYHQENSESQISFEHAILIELRRRNFLLSPEVIPTRSGNTYIKVKEADAKIEFYVAIFSFLSGEDKYEWNNSSQSDQELVSAANVLGLYHGTIAGWKPRYTRESRTVDQIPTLVILWDKYVSRTLGETTSRFERYFIESYPYLKTLSVTLKDRAAEKKLSHLPTITIHSDCHPGNLLFEDGQVTALLDFDGGRTDARCFDVAAALSYFCRVWGGTADGELSLDKVQLFLTTYQQTWRVRYGATVGFYALTGHELQCLPEMILVGAFWDLNWLVNYYYTKKPDPETLLIDFRHTVRLMKWVETHRLRLVEEWRGII